MKFARGAGLLACAALFAALAVSLRALRGPLQLASVWFRSPLGVESLFAVLFLILVFVRFRKPSPAARAQSKSIPIPVTPLALTLFVIALPFTLNLADPFLSDDYIIVAHTSLSPHSALYALTHAGGDGAYRPIGYVYYGILHAIGHVSPFHWHSAALAVHLVNCGLLFAIVWTLWPDVLLAVCAVIFFGWNGTRPEVVAWTAGNFDLLACAFTLAAVLAVFRGWPTLAAPFLILAIASKESAYAAPFLIAGLALAAGRLRETKVLHGLTVSVLTCAAMFLYRWTLFHGPGGYIDPATGRPQVLSFHLGGALKALLLRFPTILLFPVNWDAKPASLIAAASILVGCCVFLYLVNMEDPSPRRLLWLLAAAVATMLPAYHLGLIGDSLNGSRVLYLPSLAFCVFLAHLIGERRGAAILLMLCTAGLLFHNLQAWHAAAQEAGRECSAPMPVTGKPRWSLYGVPYFANGYEECRELNRAPR